MKLKTRKTSRMVRRGMAFAVAAAVGVSMLVSAPRADANDRRAIASKKKPLISAKKKTLYYNLAGKKKYTLKIKKNGVRKITSTKWKSSKKKVVAISSKKKTSVKLTAKKKGTSLITATVRYIPKGGWWHRTVKLKCKVTSKRKGTGVSLEKTPNPILIMTPIPTANPTQPVGTAAPTTTTGTTAPTGTATSLETPTPTPTVVTPQAASVVLNQTNVLLSKEEGYNTVRLTASVQDDKGNLLEGKNVVWASDNAAVATVDEKSGQVSAVSDGTANITASVDGIISKPCAVTVDTTSPEITSAVILDSKTIQVEFSEPVKGNPVVSIKQSASDEATYMDAVLAEDGKSMLLTNARVLFVGTHVLTIEGMEDQAGNKMKYNKVAVTKEESRIYGFACKTKQVPIGQSKVRVYYAVIDQYGEEIEFEPIDDLQVTAGTESGMPLEAQAKHDGKKGWIEVSGAVGVLPAGREIRITLSSEKLGIPATTLSTILVSSEGVGEATEISGVVIDGMENEGTEFAPVLTLGSGADNNVFSLSTKLLDKFGIPVEKAQIVYVIDDTTVLAFENTEEPNTVKINSSSDPVKVKALKGGETTITAYLATNDGVNLPIKIRINPNKLTGITVASPLEKGINGRVTELETNLEPAGTGLTADDLMYKVEEGEREDFDITFAEEDGKVYTKIAAKANGKENTIQFRVVYGQIESEPVTYRSVPLTSSVSEIQIDPFEEKGITVAAMGTAVTEYRLLNRYGEDITKKWEGKTPDVVIQDTDVIQKVELNANGELTVTARNQGETVVLLYLGEVTASLKIKVAAGARVSRIVLADIRGKIKRFSGVGTGEAIDIPIDHVEDQYGNKPYKLTAKEFKELQVKVAGGEAEPLAGSIFTITPYYNNKKGTDSADNFQPIPATDSDRGVDAIHIDWASDKASTLLKAGSDCVLDFLYNGESVMDEEKFTLEIQEERLIDSITMGNKGEENPVAPGATVSIAFTVKDQYGDNVTELEGSLIGVDVIEVTNKNSIFDATTPPPVPAMGTAGRWTVSFTVPALGSYMVYVYKKENGNTTYQNADIRSECALRADDPKNVIKGIAVSPIVDKKITAGDKPEEVSLDLDVLEKSPIDYIYVKPGEPATITFKPVVKDGDGNEITLSAKDREDILWNVSSEGSITTNQDNDKVEISGSVGDQGTITVFASYIIKDMRIDSEPRTIKVKCEKAIPQKDSYEIHRVGDDTVDYTDNGFYEFSTSVLDPTTTCTFEITAKDQNGNSCEPEEIQLDRVTVTNGDKAEVSKSDNKFTVTMKQWGEAQINVFLPEKTQYQFSVGVKPEVMTAGLHDCKNEVTGELFKKDTYKVTTSLDRENSTDNFTVVTVKIQCEELKEHWNGANPQKKGYWVGILVPMDTEGSRCCVQSNKKASDIIKEIESGKQSLNDFTAGSKPDHIDDDSNLYWAFYYDKGATNEEKEELGGYAVMKDKADHYIIYMIDMTGVSKATEQDSSN